MSIPSRTGATAGVATGAPPSGKRTARRRRAALAGAAITGLASSVLVPGSASAATMIPVFPDNIVVFPNRDMVVLEGGFGGDQPVLVEVKRGGQLMGAVGGATVTDGEWEVNHPGGPCWGDGTTVNRTDLPKVTPDIRAGDVVSVRNLAGQLLADTVVQDAHVDSSSSPTMNADGTGFTVTGRYSGVPAAQMEQRIVNPDLKDTPIQRRDIRAVVTEGNAMEPGPLGGYTSRLEVSADGTLTAHYDFSSSDDPATAANEAQTVAALAAGSGGERVLSWEVTDGGGNRQGLTIAEDDEPGGAGMSGCPTGPSDAAPTAGQFGAVWSEDGTSVQVSWTPATTQPGAPEVTGYSVEAIAKTADADGEFPIEGRRTAASDTRAVIGGLTGGATNYTVEVRSLTGSGTLGAAFGPAGTGGVSAGPADPPVPNDVAPTGSPAPGGTAATATPATAVTLSGDDDVEMYYTTDGTDPLASGGVLGDSARVYTGPIAVDGPTQLRWVGYNSTGVASPVAGGFYDKPVVTATAPAAPGVLRSTPGNGSVALTWQAGADNGAPITGYTVTTLDAGGSTPVGTPQNVEGTTATVSGLTNGTEYTFRVTASNSAGTSAAAEIKARPGDVVTVTLVRNRTGDVRIAGTSSVLNSRITLTAISPTQVRTQLAVLTAGTPEVVGATGGEYEYRSRGAALARGTTIEAKSNGGGVATTRVP